MSTHRPNPCFNTGRPNRLSGSAFSLVELVLVLTIISVFAAIAVPRYGEALSRYRADAAARRVIVDLEYARSLARSTGSSVTVHVLPDTDTLKIIGASDEDQPGSGYHTDLAERPYHADVVSSQFNSDYILIYDGYGYPDSTGSIVLSVGGMTRTIEVNQDSGKAVVQ